MTPLQREDEVESWFQQKLGRKGSKREIEEWANNIALNYSSVFQKLVKDVQGLQADMGLRDWETAYLASFGNEEDTEMKKKSFNDMTDISAQLAQEDPLLQAEDRFDDIYATNGTIQTSDRNEKQDIQELSDAEQRVATACKGLIRRYKFNSAVAEKGDDARYHFGIIAQDLKDAFEAEGLDAGQYGMFISETWTNDEGQEQTRLGVRYNELLAFIIATL